MTEQGGGPEAAGRAARPIAWPAWQIAAGRFLFRVRNAVFPVLFVLAVLLMRPQVLFGHAALDRGLIIAGVFVALLGELVRLLTIGFEYIERGGRNKQVWASRLVSGGVYGLSRNPMYVGNLLIAAGMVMAAGAPLGYLVVFPLFGFIYLAIIAAEETYLLEKFGPEYAAYCAEVPRWFPSWRSRARPFEGMRYNWKRALRQDLSTLIALLLGLSSWPLWRAFFLQGGAAAQALLPRTAGLIGGVLALYAVLHRLKKRGAFS